MAAILSREWWVNETRYPETISDATITAICHAVDPLQIIWRQDTRRFYIRVSDLQVSYTDFPDSKVHRANMGSTWVLSALDGLHVGPNLAIRVKLMIGHSDCSSSNGRHGYMLNCLMTWLDITSQQLITSKHYQTFTLSNFFLKTCANINNITTLYHTVHICNVHIYHATVLLSLDISSA